MQLEKILEEIDEIKVGFDTECRRECDLFDWSCGACVGECDEYIKERAKEIIRKHMNDGWIPVEERLPDNNENVLVTTDMGLIASGYIAHGTWITDQEPDYPIAWRPLPEPYRLTQKGARENE